MSTTSAGLDDGVTATTMAIRQRLMAYFKEHHEREPRGGNISWISERGPSDRHFERDSNQLEDPCGLLIGGHYLLSLRHEPDRVILHGGTLNRSKGMRQLKDKLQHFLHTYLPGVSVTEDDTGESRDWRNDRELLAGNLPQEQVIPQIPADYVGLSLTEADIERYIRETSVFMPNINIGI